MLPKKFLVGGVATVGSVATAAVVTNGLPSAFASKEIDAQEKNTPTVELRSNQEQSGANSEATDLGKAREAERKENIAKADAATRRQEEEKKQDIEGVEKWLNDNKDQNNWQIRLKYGEEIKDFRASDPTLLPTYLNNNTALLKSIAGKDTIFTFDSAVANDKQNWKNIFTKEQILEWVKSTSGDKANLRIGVGHEAKELNELSNGYDLNKLFESLSSEKNENLFTRLKSESDRKTILFEKINNSWKHSKTEITNLLSSYNKNNLKFEIKTSNGKTDIGNSKEDNLAGLFNYLKTNETQFLKYKNPTDTTGDMTLTLKNNNGWDIVHNQNTISNWVKNTAGDKTTLKLYEGGEEKTPSTDGEWKELFDSISKTEESLFERSDEERTIIFEKYEHSENKTPWTHIKEAIEDYLDNVLGVEEGEYYGFSSIRIGSCEKALTKEGIKDNELIGLLKHLQTKKYQENDDDESLLKLEKKSNGWEQIKKQENAE